MCLAKAPHNRRRPRYCIHIPIAIQWCPWAYAPRALVDASNSTRERARREVLRFAFKNDRTMDDGRHAPRLATPRTQATLLLYCYCDLPHMPYVIHSTCHPGRYGAWGRAWARSASVPTLACWPAGASLTSSSFKGFCPLNCVIGHSLVGLGPPALRPSMPRALPTARARAVALL